MKKTGLLKLASLGLVAAALAMPSTALAEDPPVGWYYFNDGAGTCGYMQQTPYGWQVIMTFPCPREVSGD